jgi:hypothetical protein
MLRRAQSDYSGGPGQQARRHLKKNGLRQYDQTDGNGHCPAELCLHSNAATSRIVEGKLQTDLIVSALKSF